MSASRPSHAQQEAILADYKAGVPVRVISKRYSVCISYATTLAKRMGMFPRRQVKPPQETTDGIYTVWSHGIRVSLPAVSILKTKPLERGCSSAASAICSTHSSRDTADGMGGEKLDSNYRHIVVQAHPPANSIGEAA